MNSGIYQIVNKVSNKRYIGSAVNLKRRRYRHFSNLKLNIHDNSHFQKSYNKYGKENFKFEILLYCSKENLMFYEQRAINAYDFKNELYNLRPKAENMIGFKHSDYTKNLMSKNKKGLPSPLKGRHGFMSEFQKKKIKEACEGRTAWNKGKIGVYSEETLMKMKRQIPWNKNKKGIFSEETLKKLKEKRKGRTPMLGHRHSEETKEKFKKRIPSMLNKYHSKKTKKELSVKALNRGKVICSYCDKKVDVSNYARWHGINCKIKKEDVKNV